ncbi:MAG: PCYCGC domain-containing protein [Candidatus Obscuribacterales bacterium]|nr:PCYCGC domain-containing protein [Candidatus Obscuribacterales bacterium]
MTAFSKTARLATIVTLTLVSALSASAGAQAADSDGGKATAKKDVLDPNNYVGQVKAGYQAAKEIPEICAKLFCYCGCDLTDCHATLLDCFTSDHGVDCHICQEETILALKFHRKGKSLTDIQKFIDKRYSKEYPFEEESDALKKYKAERLWGNKGTNSASNKKTEDRDNSKSSMANTKRKPDAKSCCGEEKRQ